MSAPRLPSIGWRNLRRDTVRMGIAVFAVVFAVVLVTVEVGMLLGLVRNASLLIDRSRAEVWISKVDVKTFDFATPFDPREKHRIEAIPGVERVEEYNVSYTMWRLPSGGNISVQIVGMEARARLAPELELVSGSLGAIHNQDAIVIDEGDRAKLGNPALGDTVEIMGRRARIVGFTRGMRSFTTTPFVFASLERSHAYGWVTEGGKQTIYYLVQTAGDPAPVVAAINARISGVEAHTRESFALRTRTYWLLETGVGLGFLLAAFLGLVVGGAIVSQTLYAMTVERLPEFGVLKALGATMGELSRVVLEQSLICGALGLLLGFAATFALQPLAEAAGTAVLIPWPLAAAVIFLTVLLCAGAALFSIAKLHRVEPAMVFRT